VRTNGFTVGSDLRGFNVAQGTFENLRTWGNWLNAEYVTNHQQSMIARYQPNGSEGWQNNSFSSSGNDIALMDGGSENLLTESSYASNTLWLEIIGITNGWAYLALHGTVEDEPYEILSKPSLTTSAWTSEDFLLGAVGSDTTAITIPLLNRTNSLFFRARSWADTGDSGMPDWWQLEHFSVLGIDPYADADGDAWNNLQEYENGTSPTQFDAPPPPRSLTARFDTTGTNVILTWQSGGGPVTGYSIERFGVPTSQVSASTFSFTDSPPIGINLVPFLGLAPIYYIRAQFQNGMSSVSEPISPYTPALALFAQLAPQQPGARIVRGPTGKMFLVVPSVPSGASTIRLFRIRNEYPSAQQTYQYSDIAITNLVKGPIELPWDAAEAGANILFYIQALGEDAKSGEPVRVYPTLGDGADWPSEYTFVDARSHLKENLKFLLRSATFTLPFSYQSDVLGPNYPEYYDGMARNGLSTNYEHYGFRNYIPENGWSLIEELRPVQENSLWRNFAHSSGDFSNGLHRTGASYDVDALWFAPLQILNIATMVMVPNLHSRCRS
jgi:hypothetical protein